VTRGIDNIKKRRGEATTDVSQLRMKVAEEIRKGAAAPPIPAATLKLK
jgi:hypothetical protein